MSKLAFTEPFARFEAWFAEAKAKSGANYPNAMHLATVAADGTPSARIVLLKGMDTEGFVFYTNLDSQKSQEIAANHAVALTFFWEPLGKQIRIEGTAIRTSEAESDAYFATRPRDSQIGAWASQQSRPMASRDEFEHRIAEYNETFAGKDVPRPPHWGGWRVVPNRIEFWEEMPFRLHKRDVYRLSDTDAWTLEILYP